LKEKETDDVVNRVAEPGSRERWTVQRWIVNCTGTTAEFEEVKTGPQKMIKERPQRVMKEKENRAFFIAF